MKLQNLVAIFLFFGFVAPANANLVTNPDFESGDVNGWTLVGQNDTCNSLQAVQYSAVPGFGGTDSIASLGGDYAAYVRPGGAENAGIMQTVSGVPSVELAYSVDFYVREVQLPGDSRTEQTIYLYFNDTLMDELTVGAPTDDPGTVGNFSGTFDNVSSSIDIKIVSQRPSCGFAWGQLIIDNVLLNCTTAEDCLVVPPVEPAAVMPVPALTFPGIVILTGLIGLLLFTNRKFLI